MSTEELKQKAERWVAKYVGQSVKIVRKVAFRCYKNLETAYIAGATENCIKWHDLRKDPNDLPEANWKNWVLAVYDKGTLWGRARREVFTDGVFWVDSLHLPIDNVVLWAEIEIPQFKE